MYGLPADSNFDFLKGAQLIQVCTGENELILNFDRDISIMCASDIRVGSTGQSATLFELPRDATLEVIKLLGDLITTAEGSTDGTLRIGWSRGVSTELLDTSDNYESYTVKYGEQLIVV
jgi:hypothetical protein